jgi:hypothetical protein
MLESAADHVRSIASLMEGMHNGVQRWSLPLPGVLAKRRLSRLRQWDVGREHPESADCRGG